MIWITREKWESNSKTNSLSLKINSVENKYKSHNLSSRSIICFTKIKISSFKIKGLKIN